MKRSVLIIAVTITIGLLSNSVFAQTPTRDTTKKTPVPMRDTVKKTTPVPMRDTIKKTTTTTPAPIAKPDTTAKNVFATLANIGEETTFVTAITTAKLDTVLKGPGPFTVFAPNNADFSSIPKGRLDSLMKDPIKVAVMLKAHIIAGKYNKAALIQALKDGKGTATLKTLDGQTLTISVKDKKLAITDSQGTVVEVTSFDTPCTNGIIHGINGVLMYK